jgi:hypothetical protein
MKKCHSRREKWPTAGRRRVQWPPKRLRRGGCGATRGWESKTEHGREDAQNSQKKSLFANLAIFSLTKWGRKIQVGPSESNQIQANRTIFEHSLGGARPSPVAGRCVSHCLLEGVWLEANGGARDARTAHLKGEMPAYSRIFSHIPAYSRIFKNGEASWPRPSCRADVAPAIWAQTGQSDPIRVRQSLTPPEILAYTST